MPNSSRPGGRRARSVRSGVVVALAVVIALVLRAGTLRAQLPPLKPAHLNPVVEKLAAGKPVFGAIISDFSMTSARQWARSGADYVWLDMEHNPLNMETIANFIAFANDRSYTAKRGDTQWKMAITARFPPYGGADNWIVKQALDIGLMGVVFNTVNTKEEALAAVRSMRYPPQRNDPGTQKGPAGMRGFAIASEEIIKPMVRVLARDGDMVFMEVRPRTSLVPGEYAIIGDDVTRVATFRVTEASPK